MGKLKDLLSRVTTKVDDPDDYIPLFDGDDDDPSQQIQEESWGSILLGWVRGIIVLAFAGALFIGILYSLLAAFLIMWVPIGSDANYFDRANVVRNTWSETGGVPELEDKAIISLSQTKSNTSWINYAIYGWTKIPNSAEVEALSSDRDKLYIEVVDVENDEGETVKGGAVAVLTQDGQPRYENFTGSLAYSFDPNGEESVPAKQNIQLDGEILVKCVVGDCVPDSVFLIDSDQIFGERNEQ